MEDSTRIYEPSRRHKRRTLVVQVNGGSLLVEAELGDGIWIEDSTLTADTVAEVNMNMTRIRITPTGGALFSMT